MMKLVLHVRCMMHADGTWVLQLRLPQASASRACHSERTVPVLPYAVRYSLAHPIIVRHLTISMIARSRVWNGSALTQYFLRYVRTTCVECML